VKFGGQSWNRSTNKKGGVKSRLVCKHCGRNYKMDWAKINHEKLCREHFDEVDN